MDFEIQFTDVTMLEANGFYKDVCKVMKKPLTKRIVEDIFVEDWMVESSMIIQNPFGFAQLKAHFYYDGKVYISDYYPTLKDLHNPDIRCFSYWAQEFGWKRPQPLPSMIDEWPDFWHLLWETFIVDSEYFDEKYGERMDRKFDNDDIDDKIGNDDE